VLGRLTARETADHRTGHLLEMQLRHGGATHTLAAYGRDRLHREISRSQGVKFGNMLLELVGLKVLLIIVQFGLKK